MLEKLKIPLIGLVENMSQITCCNCNENIKLFGTGTRKLMEDLKIEKVASLPLLKEFSESTDKGMPVVLDKPDSEEAKTYLNFTKHIVNYCCVK